MLLLLLKKKKLEQQQHKKPEEERKGGPSSYPKLKLHFCGSVKTTNQKIHQIFFLNQKKQENKFKRH